MRPFVQYEYAVFVQYEYAVFVQEHLSIPILSVQDGRVLWHGREVQLGMPRKQAISYLAWIQPTTARLATAASGWTKTDALI